MSGIEQRLCPPDKGGGAKRRGVSLFKKNENPPFAFGSRPPYQGVGE